MKALLPTLTCLLLPCLAHARWVPAWDYATLVEKSDLVVIARATKSEPGSEKWTGEAPPNNVSFVAVETSFKIELVIKEPAPGDAKSKLTTVKLVHFKDQIIDPSKWTIVVNGHHFVSFRTSAELVQINKPEGGYGTTYDPVYLLFLKRRTDGSFEPVTGQYDAVFSVREILGANFGDFLSHLKTK